MQKTPYITYKPKKLEKNYKEFENLCKKYLQQYVIAYSVKTNSHPQLLQLLNKLGSNFEVASLKEINLTNISKKPKILNSPCKTQEELQIAIKNKFLINIDSISEINKISKLTKNRPFNIGLRISLNNSKFGFDKSQLNDIISYCKSKNLNIISLHFHSSTQQNIKDFENNIHQIEKITKEIIEKQKDPKGGWVGHFDLKYLNIGGGFPDKTQLQNLGVKLDDYFKIINKYIKKFNYVIILEPGRCLVSDAFELITKVQVIKQKPDATYAILDAGINILPKITLAKYKFSKLEQKPPSKFKPLPKVYTLAGPLLFNSDILGKFHGSLKEGDLLKVENIGAYCYNLGWEISYEKPEVV